MSEDLLNKVNLPIIIWKKHISVTQEQQEQQTQQTQTEYVCEFINGHEDRTKLADKMSQHHESYISKIKELHSFSYQKNGDNICFSHLPNGNILEIRYPIVNNYYLLSAISKKLREPLTDIIGILSLLEQMPDECKDGYFIPIINKSSYNFICLANDLVDLIRIDNKTIKVNNKSLVLLELVENCLNPFKLECQEKGITLNYKINKGVPTQAMLDGERLQQVLVIFLKNAIFNTSEGLIQLSVSYDNAASQLIFTVKDTGIGLKPELQRKIDYILNYCNCSCNLQYEGFGLFIAARLSQYMSAKITYKTEPDIGSAFSITYGGT